MVTNLRKEYLKNKEHKDKIIDEAALSWLDNNCVIINEKLERSKINRLTNNIVKFDEKFGAYKDKLPAIQSVINNAEVGLQLLLTGKTSQSRAADMLQQLALTYNMLSNFFAADLPILLKTPMFAAAKAEPDKRLDMITGTKYDPKVLVAAFETALRPSKEELKIFGKVYKGIPMPNMKIEEISWQLLGLSYNELMDLTRTEKIPMVAVPEKETTGALPAETQETLEEAAFQDFLKEAVDPAQLNNALAQLEAIVTKSFPDVGALKKAVGGLRADMQRVLTGGGKLSQMLAGGGVTRFDPKEDIWRSPEGRLLAQTQMAIDNFSNLSRELPKVTTLFADGSDPEALKKYLLPKLQGGIFKRFIGMFKTQPFTGLTPQDIVNAVVQQVSVDKKEQTAKESVKNKKTIKEQVGFKKVYDPKAAADKAEEQQQKNADALRRAKAPQNLAGAAEPKSGAGVPTKGTEPPAGAGPATPTTGAAPATNSNPTTTQPQTTAGSVKPKEVSANELSKLISNLSSFGPAAAEIKTAVASAMGGGEAGTPTGEKTTEQPRTTQTLSGPTGTENEVLPNDNNTIATIARTTGVDEASIKKLLQTNGISITANPKYFR